MACRTPSLPALTIILAIGIGSCSGIGGSLSAGSTKTPAFIFGDSSVEPGKNNHIHAAGENAQASKIFGKQTGRFLDGRVIVDFIVANGVNFASGGAGVLSETNHGQAVIPLQKQLTYFEEVELLLTKELGDQEQAKKIISEAVYFISIGTNDHMTGYTRNPQMRESFSPQESVGMVIGNLTRAIQTLCAKGGKKFGFLSLCSLGCMPAQRAMNPKANGGCVKEVSALALAHNHALSLALTKLEQELQGFK